MREIKFRAWRETDISCYKKPMKFEWDLEQGKYCRFVYKDINVPKDEWFSYSADCVFCDDDWIKEQFTGLYDKNGKEIYEGDLIATSTIGEKIWDDKATIIESPLGQLVFDCFYWNISQVKKGLVIFNKDDESLTAKKGDTMEFGLGTWDGVFTAWEDVNKLEIIGNIHDNPELLEKENK